MMFYDDRKLKNCPGFFVPLENLFLPILSAGMHANDKKYNSVINDGGKCRCIAYMPTRTGPVGEKVRRNSVYINTIKV